MFLGMSKVMRTAVPSVLGLGEWQITWVCHDNHDNHDDDVVVMVVMVVMMMVVVVMITVTMMCPLWWGRLVFFSVECDTEMIPDLATSFYRTEKTFLHHLTFNI